MARRRSEPRSDEAILSELAALRAEIGDLESSLANLYERRANVLVEARTREPKIVQSRLAEAAGVTEAAVIRVLRMNGVGPRFG